MLASIAKLLPHPIKTFVKTAEKPNGRSEFHFLLFALEVLTSKKIAQLEKEKGEVRVFHHPKKKKKKWALSAGIVGSISAVPISPKHSHLNCQDILSLSWVVLIRQYCHGLPVLSKGCALVQGVVS